jgi:hypothetical protein
MLQLTDILLLSSLNHLNTWRIFPEKLCNTNWSFILNHQSSIICSKPGKSWFSAESSTITISDFWYLKILWLKVHYIYYHLIDWNNSFCNILMCMLTFIQWKYAHTTRIKPVLHNNNKWHSSELCLLSSLCETKSQELSSQYKEIIIEGEVETSIWKQKS